MINNIADLYTKVTGYHLGWSGRTKALFPRLFKTFRSNLVESISDAVYNGTDCGAWCDARGTVGITLGSIVEGSDTDCECALLDFPFAIDSFWLSVQGIEDEAEYIWNQTHGCDDCGIEGEWGHDAINPDCETCGGNW